jgi:hypothetical protein
MGEGHNFTQLKAHILGHRLIMTQPELCGSEFEHGEEVCGVLLVAGGEASEVFDAVEEPFDTVARPVEYRAEARLPAAMHHRRDVWSGTGGLDLAAQPVGIVGLIGEYDSAFAQVPEQALGDRAIARLARSQDQFEGQTIGVDERVNLGRQPAARAAHTAIRVAFFELAAC